MFGVLGVRAKAFTLGSLHFDGASFVVFGLFGET